MADAEINALSGAEAAELCRRVGQPAGDRDLTILRLRCIARDGDRFFVPGRTLCPFCRAAVAIRYDRRPAPPGKVLCRCQACSSIFSRPPRDADPSPAPVGV